jgi:hypothetical protein
MDSWHGPAGDDGDGDQQWRQRQERPWLSVVGRTGGSNVCSLMRPSRARNPLIDLRGERVARSNLTPPDKLDGESEVGGDLFGYPLQSVVESLHRIGQAWPERPGAAGARSGNYGSSTGASA